MIEDVNSIIEQSISKFNGMGFSTSEIVCVGITCQRETLVVWNKNTGKPVYDAIGLDIV